MDRSHERDQAVERLLRQSRHVLSGQQDADIKDSCLDAETVAAWADGGLSDAALERAETHVAGCARCQSLVGALARINSAVPPAEPARAARWWLTWLVPLAAASVAVAVWVAVPRNELDRAPEAPQSIEIEGRPATQAQEPASQVDQSQSLTRGSDLDAAKKEAAGTSQPDAQMRRDSTAFEADSVGKQAMSGANAPPAPAVQSPATPADTPPSAATAPRAAAGLRAETVAIEIASPDPMVRWRIAGSDVQRSTDGGASWASASTGIAAELTAGVAPSAIVCWVVGRGGAVLLSTDGRSWRRLPFPEVTDLSGIRARDALAASVSTADGRTFSTTDAGATWVPRPLQDF